jgi:hypothetical protein
VLVGVDPAPEPGVPFRDDLGRVWHPIKEGSQTYTFDGRHFETLPDLHMRTDLFLTA